MEDVYDWFLYQGFVGSRIMFLPPSPSEDRDSGPILMLTLRTNGRPRPHSKPSGGQPFPISGQSTEAAHPPAQASQWFQGLGRRMNPGCIPLPPPTTDHRSLGPKERMVQNKWLGTEEPLTASGEQGPRENGPWRVGGAALT